MNETKFIESNLTNEYEVWTDDGWVDIVASHKTIPYKKWFVETETHNLICADKHVIFIIDGGEEFETYVEDLNEGDSIMTDSGKERVLNIAELSDEDNMYDLELVSNSKKKYFTNGILSHNTSIINVLSSKIIKDHKGVVFYLNNQDELQSFCSFIPGMFRQIEANTPILCVLEDLETFTAYHEVETLLLNVLDGASQMHNIVFLACTNYPEELKERILNRPNRFDKRYYIGAPSKEVRKFYFEKKLKKEDLEQINIQDWIEETEGFSLAHLGELVKSVFVLGNEFSETINDLKKMKQKISSSTFGKETNDGIGFLSKKTE